MGNQNVGMASELTLIPTGKCCASSQHVHCPPYKPLSWRGAEGNQFVVARNPFLAFTYLGNVIMIVTGGPCLHSRHLLAQFTTFGKMVMVDVTSPAAVLQVAEYLRWRGHVTPVLQRTI